MGWERNYWHVYEAHGAHEVCFEVHGYGYGYGYYHMARCGPWV